jgi:sortase A
MRSLRFFERSLLIAGVVLLLVYAGSQAHSFLMSRTGLLSFRAHLLQPTVVQAAKAQSADQKVNFSLWSIKRIQAYKDSLALKFEAPIAVLTIPKIGIEVPVFAGTDDLTLNRGAGMIAGTASPGKTGNMGIAGHRDGFFRRLKDIRVGDHIELFAGHDKFVYAVEDITIVDPSDVTVLSPRPRTSLTLVTCYPFYFVGDAPQRYIVHASLVDTESATASSLNSAVQQKKSEETP